MTAIIVFWVFKYVGQRQKLKMEREREEISQPGRGSLWTTASRLETSSQLMQALGVISTGARLGWRNAFAERHFSLSLFS